MAVLKFLLITAYLVLAVLEIRAAGTRDLKTEKRVKPLLMPVLLCWYAAGVFSGEGIRFEPLLAAGLFFGFLGDTVLLIPGQFVAGLIFFLLGHGMYIPLFLGRAVLSPFRFTLLLVPAILILYAAVLVPKLMPSVPRALKLPVLVYLAVILVMCTSAGFWLVSVPSLSSALSFAGAVLFLLSDTMLAFMLFGGRSPRGVMETYLAAQYLIARSFSVPLLCVTITCAGSAPV